MEDNSSNISTNVSTNISIEDQLLQNFGPKRHELPIVIILLLVYSLIFISGLVGNICTCIVIVRNSYMQTPTNYYLFSLAISDVLTLIFGLPQEAYAVLESYPWRFGEAFCLFKSCLFEMTSCASVLTITAFTIERYIAICYPLKAHKIASLSRTVRIIIGIWIFSFFCSLPYPVHTRTFYYLYAKDGTPILDSLQCNIPHQWVSRMKIVFQISSILFFAFPMSVITILYIMIGIDLRKTSLSRSGSDDTRGSQSSPSINTVLKILVAVVVAFFVCWAPFHAQRLMTVYVTDWSSQTMQDIQRYLFYISGVLFFVGSTVNPMLYNVMSVRYRQAFRDTIARCTISGSRPIRNASGYIHINHGKRTRKDVVCFHNEILKRSFDDEQSQDGTSIYNVAIAVDENKIQVICPTCRLVTEQTVTAPKSQTDTNV